MSALAEPPAARAGTETIPGPAGCGFSGKWKPVLTLLVLSPAIGELLSGSSPPLQFFNPFFLLLLVGLYGCGALLVREIVVRRQLNAAGLLLLGAAYGIIEEGLACKSFFNPFWTDTGFLSIYGRAGGVNWVWGFGLTYYHAVVSITVPIFITEALFPNLAAALWLRRRGWAIAGSSLSLVTLLGFVAFDNRQFHLIEMQAPLALARQLDTPKDPLASFIASQLTARNREWVRQAVTSQADSPELRHALQEELNRLLPRADLYSDDRFAGIELPDDLRQKATQPPSGDKRVELNRALLERAFPGVLPARDVYPFRPGWLLTLSCVVAVAVLARLAFKQAGQQAAAARPGRPWLTGVGVTAGFIVIGFVLPGMVEHGARIPALVVCALWCGMAALLGRVLQRMEAAPDRLWRRGLWATGVLTPWAFWALLLGVVVRMIGAKSMSGMAFVSVGFGLGILLLARAWRRRLA